MEMTFKKGELRSIIAESSQEFKAKLGPGVESGNKKNNDKAYKDAKKRAEDYDGGLDGTGGKKAKYVKNDFNGTLLDYNPENADDKYRKRVKAHALGYSSEAEMKNGLPKAGDFEGNKAIYDGIKKSGEEMYDAKEDENKKGLVGRVRPDGYFKREKMYESIKTVRFKKTEFLSEDHMLSRIPDEFKKDGNVFRMKDKNDSEYIVEWNGRPNILEHTNKAGFDSSVDRMRELMGYNPNEHYDGNTAKSRLDENDDTFKRSLDIARGFTNNNSQNN